MRKYDYVEPIRWYNDKVEILDQRKLPKEVLWFSVNDAETMASAIRSMTVRGAPLIGICAAYGIALEAKKNLRDPLSALEVAAELLVSTRPTAVNLQWAVTRMMEQARKTARSGGSLAEALTQEAIKIHEEDRLACAQIGKLGAALLPGGNVLTHCNTGSLATGGDGTAYAVLKEMFRQGKLREVFVCEARPFLQGARLTAFELLQDGIPFTLITDSMAGHFISRKMVQSVVVGADRIASNGDTANKIGTYNLAVLAKENQVPFYVAAPTTTLDFLIPTGDDIPIEERNPMEVTQIMGFSIAPLGIKAAHPAFDVTPERYIRAIITEKGTASPPMAEALRALQEIPTSG